MLTGEADLLDLLVGTKLIPNGREMGVRRDHLKDIGRYACPSSKLRLFRPSGMTHPSVTHLYECEDTEWRLRWDLDDNCCSNSEGGPNFAADHPNGKVPRTQGCYDTHGLADSQHVVCMLTVNLRGQPGNHEPLVESSSSSLEDYSESCAHTVSVLLPSSTEDSSPRI
jgi:hypothetical protein